jgi:ribose-phosphate pyrophosphokinase
MTRPIKIFSGSSHPTLALAICDALGQPLSVSKTLKFSNENLLVQVEENVREADVFVVQTASAPLHDHVMELLILIDALKHASAARITAVLPYMPYVRSDKKDRPRISITARLMADLLETAGAQRVLLMDLHAPQIQGFFRMPADHLAAAPLICDYLRQRDLSDAVLVAGDAGEVKDILKYAKRLNLPIAIIDKRRSGDDEQAVATNIIGHIEGKQCILVDDEIASGGTIASAAQFLKERGAGRIIAACTHPVLSGQAIEKMDAAPIDELIVTNTLPIARAADLPKLTQLSVARLFADAIHCIHTGRSVSALFDIAKGIKTR